MLTKNALDKIRKSQTCRNRLAYEMDVNARTIDRWVKFDDIMLTTALAIKIIKQETGLTESQILEPVEA